MAIAVCLFGNLGAIGLTGPDEPRYVWIARAMAETGDWITPRLYGTPWFEKPALYYWAAAVGFLLKLPAEWAARLPSAIAALGTAIATGWLAKKHYGGDVDSLSSPVLLAPVLFATSVAAIGFARGATPDMLFTASLVAAMACSASILRDAGGLRPTVISDVGARTDSLPLALLGGFLGLAVLAKGPAAIILAGGAVAIWALATRQWRAAIRLVHPIAILAAGLVAIPWYALCAVRNRDFLRVFLWQHNVERYATPIFHHRQPFWYYGPIVLLALLPWTVLLWPVAREAWRVLREKSWFGSPGFFFACWAAWPVVFFSVSQSKLPGYILPAIPPLALLSAVAATRRMSPNRFKARPVIAAIGAALLLIGLIASFARSPFSLVIGKFAVSLPIVLAVIAFFVGAALLGLSVPGDGVRVALVATLVALGVEIVSVRWLPVLDPAVSARPHAEFMRNDQHPDRIFTYQLSRSWIWGLNFYFRRELPEWSTADPRPALVLTTQAGLEDIRKVGRVSGEVQEFQPGLIYVPILPAPGAR